MVKISERQIRSWERAGLVPASEQFTFTDLIGLRTLAELHRHRIRPKNIGQALDSLKTKLSDVKRPLSELKIVCDGKNISVMLAGQKMEAISGQFLFDFDVAAIPDLRTFPGKKRAESRFAQERAAENWFQRGLMLEETGAPVEAAIDAYQRSVELNPMAAGALVNLGTIYYRMRRLPEAEKYYRQAVEADPRYALAHFNLGNLYDEQARFDEARKHYHESLKLNPQYADAHFNLALLCEKAGDTLKAVGHWKTYLKLDGSSSWAKIARRQLERLRLATVVERR